MILYLCRYFSHIRVDIKKVILASLLSALGQCFILFMPYINSMSKLMLGFGGGTFITLWQLFRPKGKRGLYVICLKAYGIGIFLGGVLLILQRFSGNRSLSMISVSLMAGGIAVFTPLLHNKYDEKNKNKIIKVDIHFSREEKISLTALVDSGNSLVEPISGLPVSVVAENSIIEYKEKLRPEKFRLVPFRSVGEAKGILEAYFIDKIKIYGKNDTYIIEPALIGIAKEDISTGNNYHMILHPLLLENRE